VCVCLGIAIACSRSSADPFNYDPQKAQAALAAAREKAAEPIHWKTALNKRLPEVRCKAIPFEDVVSFLSDVTGLPLLIDLHALEARQISKKTPVTLELHDETISKVVTELMKASGADTKGFRFEPVDGLAVMSTPERLTAMKEFLRADEESKVARDAAPAPLSARLIIISGDPCIGGRDGLELAKVPLENALQDLANRVNVQIRADWESLRVIGIDPQTPIDTHLPNTSLRCALVFLFTHVGPVDQCVFREENGAVVITTNSRAAIDDAAAAATPPEN
jgi:hypothetical protein